MKKYTDQFTPEQREKYKDNKYFKLLENATYSEGKKGEVTMQVCHFQHNLFFL